MNRSNRREELHRLAMKASTEAESERSADGAPVTGDAVIFPGTEPGLEWLLVAREPSGEALLVPLDAMPLVGARDLLLEEEIGEPLTARCSFAVRLAADALAAGTKVRHAGEETARRVEERLALVESGALAPTLFEREAEADSEYRAWSERLQASRAQIQTQRRITEREIPDAVPPSSIASRRRPRRAFSPAYALAAALAVAVVGLSIYAQSLRLRVRQAADPVLLPTGSAGEIRLGSEERGVEVRLLAAGEGRTLLYLVFRDVPEASRYVVRLLRPDGTLWWQSRAFPRGEQLLVLPVRTEPMRLQLLGIGEDGSETVLDDRRLVPSTP